MAQPTFTLAPQYMPAEVEARLSRAWLDAGLFTARADSPRPPYVIVIPPPNVTAILHMGHGLNNVVQDVLIRFERMRQRETLWLPGTDHAGIATQNIVERQLAAEGRTRFDVGRERFIERTWAFVKETGSTILEQLRVIGCSCDWSRTRFTLDAAYSRAVREAFVRLWNEKLIYRGHRVIHWCPRCLTALSDEEAEFTEETGKLYYIRYPVEGGPAPFLTVATTRPETLLGDTAVAVSPKDKRHRGFVGKTARLPLTNIAIPILADDAVDPEFGTGFVKVTPAHDANDFEIGLRHKLEMPLVIAENGTMVGAAERIPPELRMLERFDARKKIVKLLEAQDLLEKVEPYQHAVRHCYRCDTVVEPRLSDQWFVSMQALAEPALAAYRDQRIRFVPEHWGGTYEHWMENIRDWNISRQLWWGHRIPVFTCTQCKHQWADREDPAKCPECGGPVEQDPDVLDTWFSSWLWPFATLGWPDHTPDLKRFYPGHTLVTAPEILFFWVARMIMAGSHFMRDRPFSTVYLHGTVRDTRHRKMSKSLGNGIDPIDVVGRFGADALRWTCIANTALGQDLTLDPDDLETTFAPGRNFANKLWNIGRFILAQLPDSVVSIDALDPAARTLADRWILTRASHTVGAATAYLEQFRLDEAAKVCFQFTWGELADWYVEAVKPRLAAADANARMAHAVLAHCFDVALRLLHPVVPFISEELWQKLPGRRSGEWLAVAPWPARRPELEDTDADVQFERVKQVIERIREIRAEYRVPPKTRLRATLVPRGDDRPETFAGERETITRLAALSELSLDGATGDGGDAGSAGGGGGGGGGGAHAVFGDASEVFVALGDAIDVAQECTRLGDELERLDRQLGALTAKLGNASFVSRAPADVVARERDKERTWRGQRAVVADKRKALGCG